MMKQIVLYLFLCFPIWGFAQVKTIYVQEEGPGDYGASHRNVIPVDYDDDQISIRPDTVMYQAEVTVKDQKGQVMNRQRMDLVPGFDNTLSVPDTPESEKQQVEIIVDKKKYNGYLE